MFGKYYMSTILNKLSNFITEQAESYRDSRQRVVPKVVSSFLAGLEGD